MEDSDIRDLTKSFKFLELKKGENVMKYGDAGDKFYTIIEGKVSVEIPNPGIKHWSDHRRQFKQL